jgi:4a-hydroxytetrahydrobiopterin dehydratase
MTEPITARDFHKAAGAEDWRVVGDGACAYFRTATFAESARLVQAIGEIPGVQDHLPDVDVRPDGVTVRLLTKSRHYYGMSQLDLELARQISAIAREHGLTAEPSSVQSILVVPGAPSVGDVMPFWQAALGYEPRPDSPAEDLVDPRLRGPAFWFEEMNEPRQGGGAIHIAVWVPPDQAEARLAAALAAGGHLVYDRAPAWWTLADSAGNQIDIASVRGRD